MGPLLSIVQEIAGWQTPDDTVTGQTHHAGRKAGHRTRSLSPFEEDILDINKHDTRTEQSASSIDNMECQRRGSVDLTHAHLDSPQNVPLRQSNLALDEYKQMADRILKDFARFEWPREVDDASSSCPSLVASDHSPARGTSSVQLHAATGSLQEHREGASQDPTVAELKASAPYAGIRSIDPGLMQHLRHADRRWSGPSPGYINEVYNHLCHTASESRPEPTRLSDITGGSSPETTSSPVSEEEANDLIDALNTAFEPTLTKYARRLAEDLSDSNSDVSSLDLAGSDSDASWQTAENCDEQAGAQEQRRHSLVVPSSRMPNPSATRGVSAWAIAFGSMTASI
ncbi:hypothetical protein Slin15195_G024450 [Septoria linicola]|uniref:Uncharacterized protein n=1 Tax=Septoria linicola TaxID=215465 RepID=A0A9Q9EET1_9PEZI|nr:hypothetical protein Slin14017_G023540 [Septoria linicola]USW49126.1 hypothetical protein Slin15195_G024450 [Septoria linicola]